TPGMLPLLFRIDKNKECSDYTTHMVPDMFHEPAGWTEPVPQAIPPKLVTSFPDNVAMAIGSLACKAYELLVALVRGFTQLLVYKQNK
ncbi:hypothetical protein HDU98_007950, partial [Podochytrium sp. JEL0797]